MNKRQAFKLLRSPEGRKFFLALANDLHSTLGLIPDGSDENFGEYLTKRLFPRTYIAAQDLGKEKPTELNKEKLAPKPLAIPNATMGQAVQAIRKPRRKSPR